MGAVCQHYHMCSAALAPTVAVMTACTLPGVKHRYGGDGCSDTEKGFPGFKPTKFKTTIYVFQWIQGLWQLEARQQRTTATHTAKASARLRVASEALQNNSETATRHPYPAMGAQSTGQQQHLAFLSKPRDGEPKAFALNSGTQRRLLYQTGVAATRAVVSIFNFGQGVLAIAGMYYVFRLLARFLRHGWSCLMRRSSSYLK